MFLVDVDNKSTKLAQNLSFQRKKPFESAAPTGKLDCYTHK